MSFCQWRLATGRASALRTVGMLQMRKCRPLPSIKCMPIHISAYWQNDEDDILNKAVRLSRATLDIPIQTNDLIQSIDSYRPKNTKPVLNNQKYDKLTNDLDMSFTVPQLRQYLKTHEKVVPKKHRKSQLIQHIIHDLWGFSSQEMVKQKALMRKKDAIQKHFKTNRRELFFIIGDNGDTLQTIENENNVKITVLIDSNQFIVEGLSKDVDAAQHQIRKYLDFTEILVDYPTLKPGVTPEDLIATTTPILPEISKETRTFIEFVNDKIELTALSSKDLDYAKRLLSQTFTELNITAVKSLHAADETYLRYRRAKNIDYLLFLPVHDSAAMPVTTKKHGWSRLSESRIEDNYNNTLYHHLTTTAEDSVTELEEIQQSLMPKPIPSVETNILLEARFGNLLFQNPKVGESPFLQPPINSAFSVYQLMKLMKDNAYRRFFFESHPPPFISKRYLPVLNGKTLHRRSAVLEYVNKNMLINLGTADSGNDSIDAIGTLERLQVEYVIGEDGSLSLEHVMGEYGRRVIDVIGWKRDIDLRLLAKQSVFFANDINPVPEHLIRKPLPSAVEAVLAQCRLTGYSDFYCPPSLDLGASETMNLVGVSFKNEARYLDEEKGCLISISDIDTQQSRTRHTALSATPVEMDDEISQTWSIPSNGFRLWTSFTDVLGNIGRRWHYE
ncbi:mitochondrial inner-membrane-bound regulator-domain-containing protein [Dichotomocladium elegans]|nr:mitochondrial inner-membrane-bound regulator-domain-containing protein [Dichotomocladium elegans]